MRRPTRYSLLLVAGLLSALAVALVLRTKAPPEVARLLPECDAIVYMNVKPLRAATHIDKSPVARTPEFQHFIDSTGIVPERDLDALAFALHRMDNPNGPNGPVAYSEVFEGRFDGARLQQYLAGIASARESYAGHDIYTIPAGDTGRHLRVTQLGYDSIAASNTPTPEQIHAILDRHRAAASPFSGSSLLAERYKDVPVLSSAWGIGHIGLPLSESGFVTLFGLRLPLPEDTTFVASLRYLGSLHIRVEELAPTEIDAAQTAQALTSIMALLRAVAHQQQPGTQNPAIAQMIDSVKIEPNRSRMVVTASLPLELLRQLTAPTRQAPLRAPAASQLALPFPERNSHGPLQPDTRFRRCTPADPLTGPCAEHL